MKLYANEVSSATSRVKIALALKGLAVEIEPVTIFGEAAESRQARYRAINQQGLVPALQTDTGELITQSLAIIEYLDESYEGELKLLPATARDRARVRGLAQIVACDIHPLGNLRVLQYLEREFNTPAEERERWSRHWIREGFDALESLLADSPSTGQFCEGDDPSLADVCLVPQVYNARRWGLTLDDYPTIARIEAECLKLDAFQRARPEAQPDAPAS